MTTKNIIAAFTLAFLTSMLALPTVAAARSKQTSDNAIPVAVVNGNFTDPNKLPVSTWTVNSVPGWQVLPESLAGVWHPATGSFGQDAQGFDNSNVLWINQGGVSQTLPTIFEPSATYTFSVYWAGRNDSLIQNLALQFVAGSEIVASCTPPVMPAEGQAAQVMLTYQTNKSTTVIGQPITIRILKSGKFLGQVDIRDVEIWQSTAREYSAASPSKQCSMKLQTDGWDISTADNSR